jgi:branched-chain amino acid aminotransferase
MIVYLNGRYVPEEKAHISITDHGFLCGDGVYDTLRVDKGRPVFLREHVARFRRALRRLHYPAAVGKTPWRTIIATLIRKNSLGDAAVRITVTRGPGGPGLDPRSCPRPTILVTARAFAGYPAVQKKQGVTLAIVDVQRNTFRSTPPGIKSTSCLNGVLAKLESISRGADEALMLSEHGHVAEGSVSNVFLVKNGVLITPKLDGTQLPGVTRAILCRAARRLKIPLREQTVTPAALFFADEIFLTNALMNVMPVKKLILKAKQRQRIFNATTITGRLAARLT